MAYAERPKTAEEYVKLVEAALDELDELTASYEFDVEDAAGGAIAILEPLKESLRKLRASMADGSYYFENKDLPFMTMVNRYHRAIPCTDVLATINKTHREGLDISES